MALNNQSGVLFWQPEHADALKAAVADGCSYSDAASQINATFGTAYSRNAAIGKASRMGLTSVFQPRKTAAVVSERKTRRYTKRVRIVGANGNSDVKRIIEVNLPELPALRCVEIVPRNISVLDLEPGDCRYPYGEGAGIVFCGHPKATDSSYCRPHQSLTRGQSHPIGRAGSMAATRARRIAYKRSLMGAA